jgi:hypothetical protein
VSAARRSTTPFWALGAALGVRWLGRKGLSAHADWGAQFPLARHRFGFTNENGELADDEVHQFPAVAARFEVGIGKSW